MARQLWSVSCDILPSRHEYLAWHQGIAQCFDDPPATVERYGLVVAVVEPCHIAERLAELVYGLLAKHRAPHEDTCIMWQVFDGGWDLFRGAMLHDQAADVVSHPRFVAKIGELAALGKVLTSTSVTAWFDANGFRLMTAAYRNDQPSTVEALHNA